MKIITYNVNGIRAALKKEMASWLAATQADVLCLQEVKAEMHQVDLEVFRALGYGHIYWQPAAKKGYSGVAILSKTEPAQVHYGMGMPKYDQEGRVLKADFADCSVVCVYMPSGTTGELRQQFKYEWLADFQAYTEQIKQVCPNLVVCGDFNIAHREIDIHNPVSNKNSSGFLPEERAWLSNFIESGFIDAFRHFNAAPHHYTWWSTRANSRAKNLGWRIDYHMVTAPMQHRLVRCHILSQVYFSDHCPVLLELN